MKSIFILSAFLLELAHPPLFKAGQCALFVNQPGKIDKTMVVRIEGFYDGHYAYRWWTFQHDWSVELGKVVAKQETFERLFKVVGCPDSLTRR